MMNEVPWEVLREFLDDDENGVVFTIKVKPGSAKERLFVDSELELVLSIRAKAIENAANFRTKEIIAQIFSLAPSRVEILSGQKSRHKRILLKKISLEEMDQNT